MIYLDTTILVSAMHGDDEHHEKCAPLVQSSQAITSSHALAEAFSTLTGSRKFLNDEAGETLSALAEAVRIEPISIADYLTALQEARQRGVRGGLIYDAIHAQVARRLKVQTLLTYNIKNYWHIAPDLHVSAP